MGEKEKTNDQTDAVKYVAEMLADQCQLQMKDNDFTEEDIQNMYYDHLLAEIRNAEYIIHSNNLR
jgi:hypothetical protein